MDRSLIQVGELPCVEDFLFAEKAAYLSMSAMIASAIGPSTGVAGFGLSPTLPTASLQVVLGTGWIYASEVTDTAAFGAIGTDATVIMKQGISPQPTTLTITPPVTSGYSQYYIIQVGFNEVDTGSTLAPFYNSANPSAPSSSTINTIRNDLAVVALKAGAAAPTGTQVVPVPDAGFTALWSILVVNGQTTITSANWAQLSAGPYETPWFPNLESLYSLFLPLVPATTFYVNGATGNDTWDGTVAVYAGGKHGPFATGQGAINSISQYMSPNQVTVNFAAGTYAGFSIGQTLIANWLLVGAGVGTTTVQATLFATNLGSAIIIEGHSNVLITGFTLTGYNYGLEVLQATVGIYNCNFIGLNSGASVFYCVDGSLLSFFNGSSVSATYHISGTFGAIFNVVGSSVAQIGFQTCPITITFGTTTAGQVASSSLSASIAFSVGNVAWAGSTPTSTNLYVCSQGGGINAVGGGYNFIPGVVRHPEYGGSDINWRLVRALTLRKV